MTCKRNRRIVGWAAAAALLSLAVAVPSYADWEKGVKAFSSKDYATAIKEFQQVTETNPDFAGGYYMLGRAQLANKELSPAVANLRKAVDLDGGNASYKLAYAQALLQTGEYSTAYGVLKPMDLAAMDVRYRSAYALLFAQAATRTGHSDQAIGILTRQLAADPKNASLAKALGVAYNDVGNDAKAFDAFRKAYDLDPNDIESGRSAVAAGIETARRSSSSTQKERAYRDAAQVADRVAQAAPSFQHKLLAGEAWLGAKNYQKALTYFDGASSLKPNNVLVHYYIGQCYTSLNKLDSALGELQQALRIGSASDKQRKLIYGQMGYVYDLQKDYQKAANAYQEAGDSRMVAQMKDKQAAKEQNLEADKEQAEFQRKLKALEMQIKELEQIGEMDEANQLRQQLEELKKAIKK